MKGVYWLSAPEIGQFSLEPPHLRKIGSGHATCSRKGLAGFCGCTVLSETNRRQRQVISIFTDKDLSAPSDIPGQTAGSGLSARYRPPAMHHRPFRPRGRRCENPPLPRPPFVGLRCGRQLRRSQQQRMKGRPEKSLPWACPRRAGAGSPPRKPPYLKRRSPVRETVPLPARETKKGLPTLPSTYRTAGPTSLGHCPELLCPEWPPGWRRHWR